MVEGTQVETIGDIMSKRIARGRLVPQSRSTDPRIGRVSLKAATLYDRMWINGDDQGRLSGDPDEIKYTTCPNLPAISKEDIPDLLGELETQGLIKVFSTSRHTAIQLLDWWEEHKLQWAYPSPYPPPPGWTDHLRYHPTPKDIIKENWPPSGLPSSLQLSPLTTPPEKEEEEEEEEEEGRLPSTLPSVLGSNQPSPSPTGDLIKNSSELTSELTNCFRYRWGRVPADDPGTVIPREPDPKESAQLRDFAEELSSAGGLPPGFIQKAFDEAVEHEKKHISYVRAVLLAWLGVDRDPPGEERRLGLRKRAGVYTRDTA